MRRYLVIPIIAGLLVTLGACGAKNDTTTSSGNNPSAKSSDASTTSAPTTEKKTTTTDEGEGESDDSSSDSDSDSDTNSIPSIPGAAGECLEVATVYTSVVSQAGIFMTPGATEEDIQKLADELEAAKAKVPSEISDAFDTWSSSWADFAEDMKDINKNGGFTNPANVEAMEQASKRLDEPEVKAASDEIDAYIDSKCGN